MTLPLYEAQRAEALTWCFGTKQQKDYDTALGVADMPYSHPLKAFNVGVHSKQIRSDLGTYGKGHEFATANWEVARDLRLARSVEGSSLMLGWLLAFCMGKVHTDTITTGVYRHQFSFFNPADSPYTACLPVTSVAESIGGGIKRLLKSLAVGSLTIAGSGFDTLTASAEFIGSGDVNYAYAENIPSLASVSYLASNYGVIKLGNASEDISARVNSWSVAFNNAPKDARGYFPGSGLYRGRLEIGARTAIPSLVVDVPAADDILADFVAGTLCALEIMCEGATITGGYKHYLKIIFPDLYYSAIALEEKDGVVSYSVSSDAGSVIYNPARDIPLVQAIVQNSQENYLVAAV